MSRKTNDDNDNDEGRITYIPEWGADRFSYWKITVDDITCVRYQDNYASTSQGRMMYELLETYCEGDDGEHDECEGLYEAYYSMNICVTCSLRDTPPHFYYIEQCIKENHDVLFENPPRYL